MTIYDLEIIKRLGVNLFNYDGTVADKKWLPRFRKNPYQKGEEPSVCFIRSSL